MDGIEYHSDPNDGSGHKSSLFSWDNVQDTLTEEHKVAENPEDEILEDLSELGDSVEASEADRVMNYLGSKL